jgi:hypothetical protein
MEQSGVLVGPIKFKFLNFNLFRNLDFGDPEVAWFKSRSRYPDFNHKENDRNTKTRN